MKYHSFCAANSGDGFISFFDTLLDEKKKKVYYIKGGPGSGKSTFIRSISDRVDEAELIHCSGDPDSLDGVILPRQNTVIIDATAPHSHEPKYPGIGGKIIDFGVIWQGEKINKNKIITLSEKKKQLYQNCYSVLKSVKNIHTGVFRPLQSELGNNPKIKAMCDKILKQHALWEDRGIKAKVEKRFLSAISPNGLITYSDTLDQLGKNAIILEDRWMIADEILRYLDQSLTIRGIDHINAYHPLLGQNTLQYIMIPSASLSIRTKDGLFPSEIVDDQIIRTISVQSFLEKDSLSDHRNKLIFIKRLMRELLKLAVENLSEIRLIHLDIEREYANGADHEASASIKENFINKIFP